MAGKKQATGGAPSWMVTFADMMALLLCLFVLLLSFSTMDAQKFKRIAGEMQQAFGLSLKTKLLGVTETGGIPDRAYVSSPNRAVTEMPAPEAPADINAEPMIDIPPPELPHTEESPADKMTEEATAVPRETSGEKVAKYLQTRLAKEMRAGQVMFEPSPNGVLIRFNSNFLFNSGSADVFDSMEGLLNELASILAETEGEILVSGHTDNVPISTDVFRSNWDLSSARAASLVHMLLKSGKIDKARIGATGYADSRPIGSNDTENGRALNRRVEIQLRTPDETRKGSAR
ncbi:flagellar motor protein MotB [Thalassospiraceae bacterium LMO-JJ14]|nr:flagellar motor protein MotB [Thalassospiraceae bacterium LMO-JJ14]